MAGKKKSKSFNAGGGGAGAHKRNSTSGKSKAQIVMAEKGLMLTQFEECFGMCLEHEVIKAILQSVNWDAKAAVDAFTSMVDVSNIPFNVRAKISRLADLCLSGGDANTYLNISASSPRAVQNKNRNDTARASSDASTSASEWPQSKNFKSNNKNVNCKMTNCSRSPTFTNEHRNYDKFLSDFSQLRKTFPVPESNNVRNNSPVAAAEKPTCMMQLIHAMLRSGNNIMVIMRGLPGSGKSTLAKKIVNGRGVVLSADDYFMTASGQYNYNPDKISDAHEHTQNKARKCIANHINPIVIDNTNLQKWEMRPYVLMAVQCNYKVEFLEPDTSWRYDCKQLARKTKHKVPREKIEAMLDRFERNVKMKDFDIPARFFSNNSKHGNFFFNENGLSTHKKVSDRYNKSVEQYALKPSPPNFLSPISSRASSRFALTQLSPAIPQTSASPTPLVSTNPPSNDNQPSLLDLQPSLDREPVLHDSSPSSSASEPSVSDPKPSVANLRPSEVDSQPILADSDAIIVNGNSTPEDSLPSAANSVFVSNDLNSSEVMSDVSETGFMQFQASKDISTSPRPDAAEPPAVSHAPETSVKEIVSVYKESLDSDYLLPSRESSPAIFDSDEFEDIVGSFDEEVKKQIRNNRGERAGTQLSDSDKDAVSEDIKMYQFCEDLEDKLGDTISSMIRPTLVRDPEDARDDETFLDRDGQPIMDPQNRSSLKVPDLDTVTEELSKDLSKLSLREDDSVSDGTSNDASSVELAKEEGVSNEAEKETWNCVDDPGNVCWDEDTSPGHKKPLEPLDARPSLRQRNSPNRAFKFEESDARSEEPPDLNDGWVANFQTNSWNEEPDYDAMKKTGAVPKRCREAKPELPLPSSSPRSTSSSNTKNPVKCYVDKCVQTNSDQNSGTILEGIPLNFVSVGPPQVSPDGPITKGNLLLEKSTMTDELVLQEGEAGVHHLKCFFPDIPDESLNDILCRCEGNVDWAMNVLLDGGYELSDGDKNSLVHSYESGQSSPSDSAENSSSETPSRSTSPTGGRKQVRHRKNKRKAVWQPCTDLTFEDKAQRERNGKTKTPQKPRSNSSSPASEERRPPPQSPAASNSSDGNSAPVDDYKDLNKVSLELDSLFALQLINIFGPVGNLDLNHPFTAGERRIYLPLRLCKEIHDIWNDAMSKDLEKDNRIVQEYLDSDAACALQLQLEENIGRSSGRGSPNNGDSFLEGFGNGEAPTSFKEVMELEKALQNSVKKNSTDSMALRLTRDRLCSEFSHVDPGAVKDVLMNCNGRYEEAASNLLLTFGSAPVRKKGNVSELSEAVRDTEEMLRLEQKLRDDMQLNSNSSGLIENTKDVWGEYELYRSLRKATLEKANLVTGPNAALIRSHYLKQASEFSKKMQAAETATNQVVLQQRNLGRDPNTLDLHVLTVPACLLACERFLEERLLALQSSAESGGPHKMTLSFITGWGKHSSAGKSKLKPAVKNFLSKKGYRAKFDEGNPGIITTTISL